MAYLDVVTLDETKVYLRIDDTQNETDSEISSMIRSACNYVENSTNIVLYARDKEYIVEDGEVHIYDFPINSLVSDVVVSTEKRRLYVKYDVSSDVDSIILNVGYSLPEDVPDAYKQLVLVLVKVMYYADETNQSFKELIPEWANAFLNKNRRFLI